MAAWDTGGFTPHSQSILYYHNPTFELITISLMLLGSLNFGLHYSLWAGKRKEVFRNIETISFFISVAVLFSLSAAALSKAGIYAEYFGLFRKGFYQLISAHTGTGYMTIYAQQFAQQWPALSLMGVTLAMALANQRIVLEKVQAVTETTENLIAGTAERLRTQGTEIHKQAAGTMLDMDVLRKSFEDIRAALDDISRYRQEALPQMAQNILEMDKLAAESEETIRRMEGAEEAAKDFPIEITD